MPPINNDMSPMRQMMGQNKGMMRLDHMRSPSNATEFSSSNRTPYGDDSMNGQDNYPSIMMKASRPNNLELNGPPGIPRKPILETKTDYGKYNWNNSIPKNEMPKSPMENPIGSPKSVPFKPVPPPKPKNYRPPVRGGNGTQMNGNQMWDYSVINQDNKITMKSFNLILSICSMKYHSHNQMKCFTHNRLKHTIIE